MLRIYLKLLMDFSVSFSTMTVNKISWHLHSQSFWITFMENEWQGRLRVNKNSIYKQCSVKRRAGGKSESKSSDLPSYVGKQRLCIFYLTQAVVRANRRGFKRHFLIRSEKRKAHAYKLRVSTNLLHNFLLFLISHFLNPFLNLSRIHHEP